MSPPTSPEQRFVGAFLLGTAALAVFDFWFPGVFLLLGGCLLGYGQWRDDGGQATRAGAMLLLASGSYLLWRWLGRFAPDYAFPLVMILAALTLLLRYKLEIDDT